MSDRLPTDLLTVNQCIFRKLNSGEELFIARISAESAGSLAWITDPSGSINCLNVPRDTHDISLLEYLLMVAEVTLYLRSLGIEKGDRVALLGRNSLPWMIINRAVQCMGAITVPLHAVTNQHHNPNLHAPLNKHMLTDSLAKLLLVEDGCQASETIYHAQLLDLQCFSFAEALRNCQDYKRQTEWPMQFRQEAWQEFKNLSEMYTRDDIKPYAGLDDIAMIPYTSGTTSKPKGVVLTHRSFAASCEMLMEKGYNFGPEDLILHYLPNSHIFTNSVRELSERLGVVSCFSTPEDLQHALNLYRPTIFLGVPLLWERVAKGIMKLAAGEGLTSAALGWALKQRRPGLSREAAKFFVFASLRKKIGLDRVHTASTGSDAMKPETLELFNLLGIPLREGYGQTETCGGVFVNTRDDYKPGSLGKPGPGCDARIEPRPGIDPEDTGVLWLKGAFLFVRYWRDPAKTEEVFKDGWYCTGDIVKKDKEGFFWFHGRAGSVVKLSTGEFFSPRQIESALKEVACPLILDIAATGAGKPCAGALIFVAPDAAEKLAGKAPSESGSDPAAFYANSVLVREGVARAVDLANQNLSPSCQLKKGKWIIVPETPSLENGLLTPTMKLRSGEALTRFSGLIYPDR